MTIKIELSDNDLSSILKTWAQAKYSELSKDKTVVVVIAPRGGSGTNQVSIEFREIERTG